MSIINAGNIQKGSFLVYHNDLWEVQKASFYSPGKGSALMRTTLKNLQTGKTVAYTFKSNEKIETANIESTPLQYLYKDHEFLYFMDEKSYEQYQLKADIVGKITDFFKEGEMLFVYMYDNKPINIHLPKAVKLKVVEAEESAKGNTVNNPRKNVVLETGIKINVPLFIKTGNIVSVDPKTGEYLERISS